MENTDFDDRQAALIALRCLDLTSLKDDDTPSSIEALAQRAETPHGTPAALCVHPAFVADARRTLDGLRLHGVRVATVVNFPRGEGSVEAVVQETHAAIASGADEIDVVLPWRALLAGDVAAAERLLVQCRRAAGAATMKVILETGELREPVRIRDAARIAIGAGANFVKTSTGKVAVNATPEAAAAMLAVIREHGARVGLKVAGGVATLADVKRYLALAADVYGPDRLAPDTLRFGASSLLPVLLAALEGRTASPSERGY